MLQIGTLPLGRFMHSLGVWRSHAELGIRFSRLGGMFE